MRASKKQREITRKRDEKDRERIWAAVVEDADITHVVRYEFASDHLDKGFRVLDVASGTGYGTSILAKKCRQTVGMEKNKAALRHSRKYFKKRNTLFMEADAEKTFPFEDNEFNVVVSFETIEHLHASKHNHFLKECGRVLKPGGRFIISTPRKPHGSPYHHKEYSREEFKELLGKHFKVEDLYGQAFTTIKKGMQPEQYYKFNFIAVCRKPLTV